jgi:hypothetical protein
MVSFQGMVVPPEVAKSPAYRSDFMIDADDYPWPAPDAEHGCLDYSTMTLSAPITIDTNTSPVSLLSFNDGQSILDRGDQGGDLFQGEQISTSNDTCTVSHESAEERVRIILGYGERCGGLRVAASVEASDLIDQNTASTATPGSFASSDNARCALKIFTERPYR